MPPNMLGTLLVPCLLAADPSSFPPLSGPEIEAIEITGDTLYVSTNTGFVALERGAAAPRPLGRALHGDRFHVSPSLRRLVEAGKRGWYRMEDGRPVPDPEVEALREQPADPVELSAEQVRERVLGAIAEEVGLMLAEGVVQAPMDIDLAMITGAGFQFWNGGLIPLLDREGVTERVLGRRILPQGVASVPA